MGALLFLHNKARLLWLGCLCSPHGAPLLGPLQGLFMLLCRFASSSGVCAWMNDCCCVVGKCSISIAENIGRWGACVSHCVSVNTVYPKTVTTEIPVGSMGFLSNFGDLCSLRWVLSQFVEKRLFFQAKKNFSPYVILGVRLAFSFQSKGNTTSLSCISPQKCSTALLFFFSNPLSFYPLSSAKLGDTRELQNFIDSLDRELAGAYLRELHPLSVNLLLISLSLKPTSHKATVSNSVWNADKAYVCYTLRYIMRSSHHVCAL